ncbi:hypothetical protein [Streptomyces brasiliensis]|uniref:hypothetical protein n=1 Tax=Streptomyces brasiliensis TaxID=1954 RepID=UPI00166FFB68|nr:hypothetical protein [Streptomyces brasiliensis]
MLGRGRSREARRRRTSASGPAGHGPYRSPTACTSQTEPHASTPISADHAQLTSAPCASDGSAGPGTTSSATSGKVSSVPALVAAGPYRRIQMAREIATV